jgi:hypothetical protein
MKSSEGQKSAWDYRDAKNLDHPCADAEAHKTVTLLKW